MLVQNFGGFTPSLPGIDIRFPSPEHLAHFEIAWSRQARPPLPGDHPDRLGLICVGTVVEHELRHFHDFVLNRDMLLTSWLRRRMSLNALPAIVWLMKSEAFDVIPYPVIDWARLPERARAVRRAELGPILPEDRRRFWNPRMLPARITAPKTAIVDPPRTEAEAEEMIRAGLKAVRGDLATIAPLRYGLDNTPLGQGRFTPRFAYELSALNVQFHSVIKTYGFDEGREFLSMLADQGTTYSRLFIEAMELFTGARRSDAARRQPIHLPRLSAVATWIMTGCADDGTKGGPATRLATLMDQARAAWDSVFPDGLSPAALLDHWDEQTGAVPFRQSLERTQKELENHLAAARMLFGAFPKEATHQLEAVSTYDAVLKCRRALIDAVIADPLTYVDPGLWMENLGNWPQCPVHMKFSAGRFGLPRAHFANYPDDTRYNLSSAVPPEHADSHVGDAYLRSFFPSLHDIPSAPVIKHQQINLLFELLVEPESVRPIDAMALRDFAETNWGKTLVQLL